jgi:predicted PurR-regulated permease PerM
MATVDKPSYLTEQPFNRRLLSTISIATLVGIGLLLSWHIADVLLLIFAGILLAVLLYGIAAQINTYTRIPLAWAKFIAVMLLVLSLGGTIWLLAPPLVDGIDEMMDRLPQALTLLQNAMRSYGVTIDLPTNSSLQSATSTLLSSGIISRLTDWFSTAIGVFTSVLIIMFSGLYFTLEPKTYVDGLLRLLPISKRQRTSTVLKTISHSLRWWFLGRFCSMAVVGIFTYIGLIWLGLPAAFALATFAGLLSFIPNLGPILSTIPAVMVGLAQGPSTALYVLGVYAGIQTIESYFITPMIQRSAVSLPPVFLLLVQLAMGVLFGALGLLLATPLAVILVISTQMFYIEDILGDRVELS